MQKPVLAALGVGVVILAGVLFSVDWEARAVHKRLDALVKLVEKDGAENTLMSAAKANRVPGFFTDQPMIRMSDLRRRIEDTSELKGAVLALRTQAQSVSVGIRDRELVLNREAGTADLSFRARVRVVRGGEAETGEDAVRMRWVKDEDGEWRVDSLEMQSER